MKQNKTVEIDGEIVHLAKSENIFGWRVVYSIKNSDGKINWMNLLFGGKGNLITLLFILFIIAVTVYGVSEMMSSCRDMAANPCKYIKLDCSQEFYNPIYDRSLAITSPPLS
jgi:hypothetical protein